MSRREREVRRCATDLLTHLRVAGPPIDPEQIARRQGLVVEERSLPSGVYGALWKKGNRFGIIVSDACPTAGHRRFSVAHELGHYHVDGHVDAMFAGATGMVESAGGFHRNRKSQLERDADWFASELLVPTKQLVSRIAGQPASIRALESLAEEFQTSLTMMAIRYAELTDRATASVLSLDGRVEWVFCSRRLGEHDWSRTLRKRDPIPPDTVNPEPRPGPPGAVGRRDTVGPWAGLRLVRRRTHASRSRRRRDRDGELWAGADGAGDPGIAGSKPRIAIWTAGRSMPGACVWPDGRGRIPPFARPPFDAIILRRPSKDQRPVRARPTRRLFPVLSLRNAG